MMENLRSAFSVICEKYKLSEEKITANGLHKVIDEYPYAPYIPDNWNGYLVIAEAQQLKGNNEGNKKFVEELKVAAQEDLIFRLNNKKFLNSKVGITPWDEGYIKLALKSAFPDINLNQVGVANAVPWHLDKTNKEQDKFLCELSVKYWNEVLILLKDKGLKCIIRTGEYARTILDYDTLKKMSIQEIYKLRSASQLGRDSYLFDPADLRKRYMEVDNAFNSDPGLYAKAIEPDLIFYAAHAVSTINKKRNAL